jgi:tripartite-type tricarboxylate transporter receptor subunit TctC
MLRIVRALAILIGLAATPALAQGNWPEKPVKLVVGFTAGSATDVTARMFAQKFQEAWGQPVVVENIAGNSGAIGTDRVAKAAPDGYTLMWSGNAAITILPSLQTLPFDPLKDLTPISTALRMPSIMMVNNDLPVKSMADLIAHAKANPGKIALASFGTGTTSHVAGELFKMTAGVDLFHVPYRGSAPLVTDLLSGLVQAAFDNLPASIEHIRAGKLRALAVGTAERSQALPDVPTVAEFLPGFEASAWVAVAAPKATPAEIVERLNREINAGLADPKIKARLAELGGTVFVGTPADFDRLVAEQTEKWGKVIRAANIKAE